MVNFIPTSGVIKDHFSGFVSTIGKYANHYANHAVTIISQTPAHMQRSLPVAVGVIGTANTLFFMTMQFLTNRVNHQVEKRIGSSTGKKFFNHIILNGAMGAAVFGFNVELSKTTQYALSPRVILIISAAAVALRILLNLLKKSPPPIAPVIIPPKPEPVPLPPTPKPVPNPEPSIITVKFDASTVNFEVLKEEIKKGDLKIDTEKNELIFKGSIGQNEEMHKAFYDSLTEGEKNILINLQPPPPPTDFAILKEQIENKNLRIDSNHELFFLKEIGEEKKTELKKRYDSLKYEQKDILAGSCLLIMQTLNNAQDPDETEGSESDGDFD